MPRKSEHYLPLLQTVAGDESDGGNTLLSDFILFAQKLEKLGLTYCKGKATIIESSEAQKV